MIKAGIAGATSDVAGEILRILVAHPDVELAWVYDADLDGTPVADIHRGLLGDTFIRLSDSPDVDSANLIFLCFADGADSEEFIQRFNVDPATRLIDFSDRYISDAFASHPSPDAPARPGEWVFGLPELMRKPLVRGATRAIVPDPITTVTAIGLLPLAKAGMLTDPITSAVTLAAEPAGEAIALIDHESLDLTSLALRSLLPDPSAILPTLRTIITAAGWQRGITATTFFPAPAPLKEIRKLYEDFLDDHNFTFIVDDLPQLSDVIGTNKTLIHLDEVNGMTTVTTILDDTLKGSAANAVHLMNLIFGLQERVGLLLKPTLFP